MPRLAGHDVAGLASAASDSAQAGLRRAAGWAWRRSPVPNSLTGISLLLAICAAAWFSGGSTADDLRGTLPLLAGLLAGRGARILSQSAGRLRDRPARAGVAAGSTDWLAPYPARGIPAARAAAGETAAAHRHRTFRTTCSMTGEFIVYCGIAVGGESAGWPEMWQELIAASIAIAVRETLRACRGSAADLRAAAGAGASRPVPGARPGAIVLGTLRRSIRAALDVRSAGRVTLVAAALLYHGPRVAIFTVFAWSVIAAIAGLSRRSGSVPAVRPAVLVRLRDDGLLVRWAGRLVQGNLPPLPGAVAGLAAAMLLASIGMADTIAIAKLAAPVAMLLAAPGASHRHTGRRDWLVPVLMQLSQLIYLAELGLASAVPRPLVFALCALTAIRYLQLAAVAAGGSGRTSRAGWEGRVFAAGFGSMIGLATVTYLALAAYLGVLICKVIVVSCRQPGEDSRR